MTRILKELECQGTLKMRQVCSEDSRMSEQTEKHSKAPEFGTDTKLLQRLQKVFNLVSVNRRNGGAGEIGRRGCVQDCELQKEQTNLHSRQASVRAGDAVKPVIFMPGSPRWGNWFFPVLDLILGFFRTIEPRASVCVYIRYTYVLYKNYIYFICKYI